jgi:hypothetical protein
MIWTFAERLARELESGWLVTVRASQLPPLGGWSIWILSFVKVRYRGLAKNAHRLVVTCALVNLFMARRHLLRCQQV